MFMKPIVALVTLALCGCGGSHPTASRDRSYEAVARRERAARCGGGAEMDADAPEIVPRAALVSVRPRREEVSTSKGRVGARLRGVTLRVQALRGFTAEWLERVLLCHQAGALLSAAQSEGDPFFVPGRWLDIHASHAEGGFEIEVTTADPDAAREIVRRARAYAGLPQTDEDR